LHPIRTVSYLNNKFYCGTKNGGIGTSTDGITWNLTNQSGAEIFVDSISVGSDYFIATGTSNGTPQTPLLYSNATYTYDTSTSFSLPNDNALQITYEYPFNFNRQLYIKAL
jgi:hypothetical protein